MYVVYFVQVRADVRPLVLDRPDIFARLGDTLLIHGFPGHFPVKDTAAVKTRVAVVTAVMRKILVLTADVPPGNP